MPPSPLSDPQLCLSFGAFYGDDQLKRLLVDRVKKLAADGRLHASRFPTHDPDGSTLACAMAGGVAPGLFELRTGMPWAVGAILDLLLIQEQEIIERTVGAIASGSDLSDFGVRFILSWLCDERLPWRDIIQLEETVHLRDEWVKSTRVFLRGEQSSYEAMLYLANEIVPQTQDLVVDGELAALLVNVAPAPGNFDYRRWREAITGNCFALSMYLATVDAGWTHYNRDLEKRRLRHFEKSREESAHPLTDEERKEVHAAWMRDNEEEEKLYAEFMANAFRHMQDVRATMVDVFVEPLR